MQRGEQEWFDKWQLDLSTQGHEQVNWKTDAAQLTSAQKYNYYWEW